MAEATARYQMQWALEDADGIVKSFGWKFYLDEAKFKAVIEDLRSIYPIRLKHYPYPPKEETAARELLADSKNNFTVRMGNRLYAHKGRLDTAEKSNFVVQKTGVYVFAIYTKRIAEMVEKSKVLW